MYNMAFNGPPPPLALGKTYTFRLPNSISWEQYNLLLDKVDFLLGNESVTADEKRMITNLRYRAEEIQTLEKMVNEISNRVMGGRRRRRRTRRTRRNKKSKRSTRRR